VRTMIGVACGSILAACMALQAAELGSPEFYPSPEHPVGWRGDGTGCYPGAEPPMEWGINSKAVRELSSQCGKPRDGDTGDPIPDGVIRDWLVLSRRTWSQDQDDKIAESSPDENDKVDTDAWKKATTDTSIVDFHRLFSVEKEDATAMVAYAHAYVYSRSGRSLFMYIMNCGDASKASHSKAWFNGKPVYEYKRGSYDQNRFKLPVTVGWNRLLIKVYKKKRSHQWFFDAQFFGTDKNDYEESKNILWTCPLPVQGDSDVQGGGVSSPIIVGDKVFVTWERESLCCLDKDTGRILWLRTSTYADLATQDEKNAHAEIFKEVAPLWSELREMNARNTSSVKVEMKILALMKKVDRNKYRGPSRFGDPGYAAATPTSDGQNVYVLFGSGIVVCYDLNGNRKWIKVIELENGEHGNCTSPLLIDDMLVIPGQVPKVV